MKQTELETYRDLATRGEMVTHIARAIPEAGFIEPLPGLFLARSSQAMLPVYGIAKPTFCVVAQGCKEMYLGGERYQYDPYNYLLATAELPVVSRVLEASEDAPYLGLQLYLDASVIASVMVEIGQEAPQNQKSMKAIEVSPLDNTLLDTTLRLVRLLDDATGAKVLLPLITREIIYRLLIGEQGHRLRQMTVLGGHMHRISEAVQKICRDFTGPLYVEELARGIGMSVSGFHQHFKEVTALTPLQFQKRLRLEEARRLMLGEEMDAATAAFQVGYEDASHFNHDYKRHFGTTPMRDVGHLRAASAVAA